MSVRVFSTPKANLLPNRWASDLQCPLLSFLAQAYIDRTSTLGGWSSNCVQVGAREWRGGAGTRRGRLGAGHPNATAVCSLLQAGPLLSLLALRIPWLWLRR